MFAEKLGILSRPKECESCRSRVRLERHHPDYSTPLRIWWLCPACHKIADCMHVDSADGCAA